MYAFSASQCFMLRWYFKNILGVYEFMGIAPRWKGLAQSLEIWPLPFSWRQRLITWSPASQQEKVRVLNAIYKTTLMLIYATIPLLCNFSTFNSETQFDSLKWLINCINWLNDIDKNSYSLNIFSTAKFLTWQVIGLRCGAEGLPGGDLCQKPPLLVCDRSFATFYLCTRGPGDSSGSGPSFLRPWTGITS